MLVLALVSVVMGCMVGSEQSLARGTAMQTRHWRCANTPTHKRSALCIFESWSTVISRSKHVCVFACVSVCECVYSPRPTPLCLCLCFCFSLSMSLCPWALVLDNEMQLNKGDEDMKQVCSASKTWFVQTSRNVLS